MCIDPIANFNLMCVGFYCYLTLHKIGLMLNHLSAVSLLKVGSIDYPAPIIYFNLFYSFPRHTNKRERFIS